MKNIQALVHSHSIKELSINNSLSYLKDNNIVNPIELAYGLYLLNFDGSEIFEVFQSNVSIVDDTLLDLMKYDYSFIQKVFVNKYDILHCLFTSFQNNKDVLNFYLPLFTLNDFDLSELIKSNIQFPISGVMNSSAHFDNELINQLFTFLKTKEDDEVSILKKIQPSFSIILTKEMVIQIKPEHQIDHSIFSEISDNFISITKSLMDYSDKILITSSLILGISMSSAFANESSFDKKIKQYNNLLNKTESSLPKDCELSIEKIEYKNSGTFAVKATLGDEEFFLISEGFKTPTASKTVLKSGSKKLNKCSSLSENDNFIKMKKTIKESLEEL